MLQLALSVLVLLVASCAPHIPAPQLTPTPTLVAIVPTQPPHQPFPPPTPFYNDPDLVQVPG